MKHRRALVTGFAVIIGLALGIASAVEAATLDIADGDTTGLIAALDAARLHPNTAYVINLAPESLYTLTAINNSQELIDVAASEMLGGGDQGLPLVSGNVTINGQGASIERAEDAPDFRFFLIAPKGRLTLNNLTLRNGRATNGELTRGNMGGAILSFSTLTLSDTIISDNHSDSAGGAIANWLGAVSMTRSSILRNSALSDGGGIWAVGDLAVIDSLIAENTSGSADDTLWGGEGGGISINLGNIYIQNSAIVNNSALGSIWWALGGGIYNVSGASGGVIEISNNTTISGNHAGAGGGIFTSGGPIGLRNVTIANNTAERGGGGIYSSMVEPVAAVGNTILSDNSPSNCDGDLWYISNGNNIDSDGSCQFERFTDLSGVDPMIEPLADNGGFTPTHALALGSPAIDHANTSKCPPRDQRGARRGSACDIGAYEMIPPPAVPALTAPSNNAILTTNRPVLAWSSPGSARYEIQIDTNDPPAYTIGSTSSRSFVPPAPLLPRTYYWRVRSINELNQASEWSSTWRLDVAASTLNTPLLNQYTTATPELRWGRVSWATGYQIRVDNHRNFSSPVFTAILDSAESRSIITSELPDGLWYWQVRARKADGSWGNWSTADMFVVQTP